MKEIAELRRVLEADKADFAQHITSSTRAADSVMNRLRIEEERLTRLREELTVEREQLALKKASVKRLYEY